MRTIRPPECKRTTTLQVAVKCRPLTAAEKNKCKEIVRILDQKVVLVTDADGSRQREKRYAFDYAFGPELKNRDVYNRTVASMIKGVVQGLNATIFAYGATGSGKTYTMAGTAEDPGLMVLSLQDIFDLVSKEEREHDFEITCSYLEVYNEVIYDLLEKSSGHLELREDPEQGIVVAGLKRIQVNSAAKILELLHIGNSRRKTEKTDANSTSSRSHAVLEIIVKKYCRNALGTQVLQGKVALVDLAGSERASETNNAGQKLRDGANINKSLLALANCINALGKKQKKGLAYVPYRNSKLTRILKDGLSGNSQTCMIATVSYADHQYQHTISTLKYADRAKEIKTHVQKNIGTLDSHVADYQRMINNLQDEVSSLRKELEEKEVQLNGLSIGKAQDDGLSWLDTLSRDIKENVEERINLQKALFELEDKNMHNHNELQQLDDEIARHHMDDDAVIVETLVERRKLVLDNIRDNDEAGTQYRQEIEQNEAQRKELQDVIEKALSSNNSATYLRILSQYRLLGMSNTELQLQIAVRDQIINNQREVLSNLWTVLRASGLEQKQILELASRQGIAIEGWALSSPMTCNAHKTGYPLLHDLPTSNACETCNTLGLLQFTSVTSRYHEYSNTNRTMYHTISRNIHNAYPKCQQQGLYAHGMEKNNVAGDFLHPSMLSSACGHTNGGFRMSMHSQEQGFPGREACKACLDAKRGIGMFNAPQNNMFAEAFSSMKMDSHTDATRRAMGSACYSSGSHACKSQLKHRSHSSEMRQLDCCSDKCKAGGAHNIRVDGYEIVRIRSHQQSRLTESLSHCCGCG